MGHSRTHIDDPALLSREHAERLTLRTLSLLKEADVNVRELLERAQVTGSLEQLLRGGVHGLDPERLDQLNALATATLATLANRQDGRPPIRGEDWPMLLYCLLSSRTLREAITRSGLFYRMLTDRWGRLDLHLHGGEAEVRFDALRTRRNAIAFVVDVTGMAVHHRLYSWLIGCTIPVSSILMEYGEELHPYFDEAMLPYPLTLAAGRTAMRFPAEYLDYPVVRSADDNDRRTGGIGILFALHEEHSDTGLVEHARRVMVAALRERQTAPSLEELAAQLDSTVATLRRKLARAGTSYNFIKDSCRRELALNLLRRSSMPIEDIAVQLGFCDSDAFRRAFREWMGTSPLQYRKSGSLPAKR